MSNTVLPDWRFRNDWLAMIRFKGTRKMLLERLRNLAGEVMDWYLANQEERVEMEQKDTRQHEKRPCVGKQSAGGG